MGIAFVCIVFMVLMAGCCNHIRNPHARLRQPAQGLPAWAASSAGRAPPLQAAGNRADGDRVRQGRRGAEARIAADMRAQRVDGFPFVMIGGKAVNGYSPSTFERLLSMN